MTKIMITGVLLLSLTACGAGKSEPAVTAESTSVASVMETKDEEDVLLSESKTFSEDASEEDALEVMYTDDGAMLVRNGETVFGPCRFIDYGYEGSSERFIRFIDADNGLMGYLENDDGEISVLVPGSYMQAGSFSEWQDVFARVQKSDGSWSIINNKAETLIDGLDSINELSDAETLVTGMKDGQAVLMELDIALSAEAVTILKTFPEYQAISEISYGFAIVTNRENRQGVIDCWCTDTPLLVPAEYEEVTWRTGEQKVDGKDLILFLCRKPDGSYDVLRTYRYL